VRFDVSGFELSWPWSPLQSMTGPGRCVPLRVQPPPMGFVPLRRLRSRQPTCSGLPRPSVAPSGFVGPLGAFLLPRPPRPCFVPRTPVGSYPSEPFPSRGGNASLDAPLPSCRWLYGVRLPPHPSPGCRALLPPEVRRTTAEWSRRAARCSLGLPPLQGFLPVRDGRWLLNGRLSRAWAASPLPRVSIASGPVRLRRDHRPS
jgi:hypothetical protein